MDSFKITDSIEYANDIRSTAAQLVEIAEKLERGYVVDIFDRQVPYTIENARHEMSLLGVKSV